MYIGIAATISPVYRLNCLQIRGYGDNEQYWQIDMINEE